MTQRALCQTGRFDTHTDRELIIVQFANPAFISVWMATPAGQKEDTLQTASDGSDVYMISQWLWFLSRVQIEQPIISCLLRN